MLFAVPAPVSFALTLFQSGSICPSVFAVSFQFRSNVSLDFQNFGLHVANLAPIGFAAPAFARAALATVLPLPSLQAVVHEAIYASSVQMPLLGRQGVPTGSRPFQRYYPPRCQPLCPPRWYPLTTCFRPATSV